MSDFLKYALVMIATDKTDDELKSQLTRALWKDEDLLHCQVQILGEETPALNEMWKVRQRILARRQQESRETRPMGA